MMPKRNKWKFRNWSNLCWLEKKNNMAIQKVKNELSSENMNNNEFLPGHYTDLTFEAESGSIHSASNRKS